MFKFICHNVFAHSMKVWENVIEGKVIEESTKSQNLFEKLRSNRLFWYGLIIRRDEQNVVKQVLSMEFEAYKSIGRPKKDGLTV